MAFEGSIHARRSLFYERRFKLLVEVYFGDFRLSFDVVFVEFDEEL